MLENLQNAMAVKKVTIKALALLIGTTDKTAKNKLDGVTDFTFDEACRLLLLFGYIKSNKGKTSGSRVSFCSPGKTPVMLHRPHPEKEMKRYAVKQLLEELIRNKDISYELS